MSLTELQFPPIDAESAIAAAKTSASIAVVAPDLTKIDLTDVALAMYGKWPDEVKAVKANLSTLVLDLSTPTKIKEARSLRTRLILEPLAAARKVSAGIKSKMAATSKAVGAELEKIEAGYTEADALILPKIEAREAELEREREEARKAEEARKEKHRTNLEAIRIYIDRASAPGMTAERIARGIAQLEALPTPTKEAWEEFAVPAANAICETLDKMRALHAKALADEAAAAEAERLRAENERQARELAELRAKVEAENRAVAERAVAFHAEQAAKAAAELEAARALQAQQAAKAATEYPKDGAQQVLKAEPGTADATDRAPTSASPCVGTMGAGQAADAAPAGGIGRASAVTSAFCIATAADGTKDLLSPGPITMIEPAAPVITAHARVTGTDSRDELLREALALTKYAAAPFFGKFPTHPKTTPEWWAGLREQIEALQPKLIAHLEFQA